MNAFDRVLCCMANADSIWGGGDVAGGGGAVDHTGRFRVSSSATHRQIVIAIFVS